MKTILTSSLFIVSLAAAGCGFDSSAPNDRYSDETLGPDAGLTPGAPDHEGRPDAGGSRPGDDVPEIDPPGDGDGGDDGDGGGDDDVPESNPPGDGGGGDDDDVPESNPPGDGGGGDDDDDPESNPPGDGGGGDDDDDPESDPPGDGGGGDDDDDDDPESNPPGGGGGGDDDDDDPESDPPGDGGGGDDDDCKLEGSDIGRSGASVTLDGVEIVVTRWYSKAGEPGEYIGFRLSHGGVSYEVKAGPTVFEDSAVTWYHPDAKRGLNANAISYIDLCVNPTPEPHPCEPCEADADCSEAGWVCSTDGACVPPTSD